VNITIIGTSNSVMKNAYVKALSSEHNITNLSIGRNSIFYHIKTLMSNYNTIAKSDILIIDHYINDINFYLDQNIYKYTFHVQQLYLMIKSLNIFTLVLFMPTYNFAGKKENTEYINFLKNNLDKLNISYLDLNKYNLQEHHFMDRIHIHRNVSYLIGVLLSEELSRIVKNIEPIANGKLQENPYLLLESREILEQNRIFKPEKFKNSLISIEYVKIGISQSIEINLGQKYSLLSFGYFIPEGIETHSAFTLLANDTEYDILCDGEYYFHEIFRETMGSVDRFKICSFNKRDTALQGIRDSQVMNPVEFNLVDLLLYSSDIDLKYESNNCKKVYVDLKTLNNYLNNYLNNVFVGNAILFFSKREARSYKEPLALLKAVLEAFKKSENTLIAKQIMKNKNIIFDTINLDKCKSDPEILREISLIFEKKNNIKMAYILMKMALLHRPNGPLIKQKCEEYREILESKNET